jgi:predicted DNA-binding transcriptional regulator AlpA
MAFGSNVGWAGSATIGRQWLTAERKLILMPHGITKRYDRITLMEPPTDTLNVLTPQQLARQFGIRPRTLRAWDANGTGPTPCRLSPRVKVYRREDVSAWLDQKRDNERKGPIE